MALDEEKQEEESKFSLVPDNYNFEADAFLTPEPYEVLYRLLPLSSFVFETARIRMEENARSVGFKNFKGMLKRFLEAKQNEKRRMNQIVTNQTEFDGQAMELNCGIWESTDWGIYRDTPMGGKDYACAHPIMPLERLVNIDTGEVKVKLAFKRSGKDKKWQTTIVGKDTISTARTITALASQGISVTSSTAKTLVDYLNDIENMNYDVITERKSIGRLGYIPGEGFSPFVEGLVFDGDTSFRSLYQNVSSRGSETEWYKAALECRRMSVTARIMLAASFASPILSIVGSLPFFVHLWGVDSGTGKTVALMLAASVWGDPALGSYVQSFNATQVGQEKTAAFLNHLPYCMDELQLTKDSRGKSSFDVYQLAQGVGRTRGKRNGGVELTPTWNCCFLTTGESPLTNVSSGAGAVNRVIDIECTANSKVIEGGQRISGILKRNYGFAGQSFVEHLYATEKTPEIVRDIYQTNFKELLQGDSTEKQAMAAAAIITADQLATRWIFKDDMALTVRDIQEFLASREAVSAGRRAYDWLCDWVAMNSNRFNSDRAAASGDTYGEVEGNMAYIIHSVFNDALQNAGFSPSATKSYLRSNGLIDVGKKGFTKAWRVGSSSLHCIHLRLQNANCHEDNDIEPL